MGGSNGVLLGDMFISSGVGGGGGDFFCMISLGYEIL